MDIKAFLSSPRFEVGEATTESIDTALDCGLCPIIEVDDMGPYRPLLDYPDIRRKAASLLTRCPELISPEKSSYGFNQWMIPCWIVEYQGWTYSLTEEGYRLQPPAKCKIPDKEIEALLNDCVKQQLGIQLPNLLE